MLLVDKAIDTVHVTSNFELSNLPVSFSKPT